MLTTIPAALDRRLKARVTGIELFGLALLFGLIAYFLTPQMQEQWPPFDYNNYVAAASGDVSEYYYGYWLLPLFGLLNALPGVMGLGIWMALNVLCVFFGARLFGGKAGAALLTYQMIYTVFYGQIGGVLVGGLALCWWGMAHRRFFWAGVGLLIACSKFQTGLTFGLFLWLLADLTWRERLKVLIVPAVATLISLAVYGFWPLDVLNTLQANPPNSDGSLAPWRVIGPLALLFWLPPILLPLEWQERLIALVAASALGLPYYQQADLVALYALPIGWLPLLGNIGVLYADPRIGWLVLQLLWAIPLIVHVRALLPAARTWWQARRAKIAVNAEQALSADAIHGVPTDPPNL